MTLATTQPTQVPLALRAKAELELRRRAKRKAWPAVYTNSVTGKVYAPHNDDERVFVYDDVPRWSVLLAGEGAGKTTAGVIKTLNRVRRGCDGCLAAPDLPHLVKSLWPEFVAWCPWEQVIEKQRYRGLAGWEPHGMFTMVFYCETGGTAKLYCGGMAEEDIESWMGANLNFAYVDEIRRHRSPVALKVLDGRIRKDGPKGEPPQLWFSTVPRMNWLHEYFGPVQEDDPYLDFKRNSFVGRLRTEDNQANLTADYIASRKTTLTQQEQDVFLNALWEDEADAEKFLPSVILWDACRDSLPPLTRTEPLVLAADAATGGATTTPDTFALVGVSRHPSRPSDPAVRYVQVWTPPPAGLLDFAPIEEEIRRLCSTFAVVELTYDKTELHDMMQRLGREGVVLTRSFSQGQEIEVADRALLDLILSRRLAHSGEPVLRKHIQNANVKKASRDSIRIVKRTQSLKIDAAKALSMACARCLYYVLS